MDTNFIKDIGRSYILSSMLPAALFVMLGGVFYQDFFYSLIVEKSELYNNLSIGLIIFILSVLITWIGFTLYSIVNLTVRFYEGYYLFPWLRKLLVFLFYKRMYRKKTKNIRAIMQARNVPSSDWNETVDKYYDLAWAEYGDVELSFPIREEDLLPSKLGNVLRASEQYPHRYGLTAGINLWTRLSILLPPRIAFELEEKNNNMLFLLNSSLLFYIHFLIAVGAGLSGYSSEPNKYAAIAIICLFFGYAMYISSVPVAKTIGLLIRSSFDMYRFDLLKQLNYPIPETLSQEKMLWTKISDFIVTAGNLGIKPLEFEYSLRSEFLSEKAETKKVTGKKSSTKKAQT